MLYLEAFSCSCLYVTTDFLDIQPYNLSGLFLVSREASAPRVSCPPRFLKLDFPGRIGPNLMSSWTQLHLKWIPLDDSLSADFPLPQW